MAPEPNFESMSFNPFSNNNNFPDGKQDPRDIGQTRFYRKNFKN